MGKRQRTDINGKLNQIAVIKPKFFEHNESKTTNQVNASKYAYS